MTRDINLTIHRNNYHRAQGFAPLPHILLLLCTVLQAIVGQTGKRKLPEDYVKKPRSQFSLARERNPHNEVVIANLQATFLS